MLDLCCSSSPCWRSWPALSSHHERPWRKTEGNQPENIKLRILGWFKVIAKTTELPSNFIWTTGIEITYGNSSTAQLVERRCHSLCNSLICYVHTVRVYVETCRDYANRKATCWAVGMSRAQVTTPNEEHPVVAKSFHFVTLVEDSVDLKHIAQLRKRTHTQKFQNYQDNSFQSEESIKSATNARAEVWVSMSNWMVWEVFEHTLPVGPKMREVRKQRCDVSFRYQSSSLGKGIDCLRKREWRHITTDLPEKNRKTPLDIDQQQSHGVRE